MNTTAEQQAPLLYEATARFTEVVEFGLSFQDLLAGKGNLSAAGARFDVAFAGSVQGPRLNGTITGTDYICIRADGRVQLHIHGRVTTLDGANISFFAEAVGVIRADSGLAEVRENVILFSVHADYAWVNGLAVWAETVINPWTGVIQVKAYAL